VPMLREFIGPIVSRMNLEPLGDGPIRFDIAARVVPDSPFPRWSSLPFAANAHAG
jgi:hypothetical protein